MNRKRFKRSIIGLTLAVGATLAFTASPASALTGPDGFTILPAGTESGQVHHCEVLGSADGYQAVVCTDLNTYAIDSAYDYSATGAIEVYCQTTSGTTVQCANIYAEGVFANGGGQTWDAGSYACGHSYGACPSGRKVITEGTRDYGYEAGLEGCETPGSVYEIWSVAYGGNTQIELPVSDKTFELDASDGGNDGINYSSGHYYVCPHQPTPE